MSSEIFMLPEQCEQMKTRLDSIIQNLKEQLAACSRMANSERQEIWRGSSAEQFTQQLNEWQQKIVQQIDNELVPISERITREVSDHRQADSSFGT